MLFKKVKWKRKFAPSKEKIKGRKQCLICNSWIHKKMETCEPCANANPIYSELHHFIYE